MLGIKRQRHPHVESEDDALDSSPQDATTIMSTILKKLKFHVRIKTWKEDIFGYKYEPEVQNDLFINTSDTSDEIEIEKVGHSVYGFGIAIPSGSSQENFPKGTKRCDTFIKTYWSKASKQCNTFTKTYCSKASMFFSDVSIACGTGQGTCLEATNRCNPFKKKSRFECIMVSSLIMCIAGLIWTLTIMNAKTNIPTDTLLKGTPTNAPNNMPTSNPACFSTNTYFDQVLYEQQQGGRDYSYFVPCSGQTDVVVVAHNLLTCQVTCLASLLYNDVMASCERQNDITLSLPGDFRDKVLTIGYLREDIDWLTCEESLLLKSEPTISPTLQPIHSDSVTIFFSPEKVAGTSGEYFKSNDSIAGRPIWYRDRNSASAKMMIYYCKDRWVLTNTEKKKELIDSKGGDCTGYETAPFKPGSEWWEQGWTSAETTIDNTDFLGTSLNQVLDVLATPNRYTSVVLEKVGYVVKQLKGRLSTKDPILLQGISDATLRASRKIIPTPVNPISSSFKKELLRHESDVLKTMHPSEMTKHRSSDLTYGSISPSAPRLTKVVDIDTSIGRWHPTGLYAAPGELVTVEVPSDFVGRSFMIKINANWDVLERLNSWERFPDVHWEFGIEKEIIEVANPFGGVIFIDLGGNDGFSSPPNLGIAQIKISNAIEHPYFVLGVHSDTEWGKRLKKKPAPYCVLTSNKLIIVQKASDCELLTNPTELMTWWQKVVTLQDDLAGRLDQRTSPELINVDVQLEWGIGHAGYPIQAYDKYWGNLADYNALVTEGSWGDFHELGHNHQREWWTLSGDIEVTVNIFSVYCMRTLAPKSQDAFKWTMDPVKVMQMSIKALSSGQSYVDISSVGLRLAFWIQLIDGFGVEAMAAVFRGYEEDYGVNPSHGPSNDFDKMSEWLKRFSLVTGHDLTQFMVDTWGLQVSTGSTDALKDLPNWMPAIGGIRGSFETKRGVSITFDIAGEALSLDAYVEIVIVQQGLHGPIKESSDGLFVYTPISGYTGSDSFTYAVVSSSGHQFKTTIDIRIT